MWLKGLKTAGLWKFTLWNMSPKQGNNAGRVNQEPCDRASTVWWKVLEKC